MENNVKVGNNLLFSVFKVFILYYYSVKKKRGGGGRNIKKWAGYGFILFF